jgi:hypothetical protein
MQSTKSGVSRVLGLPAKLISMPKAYIRSCYVLTVTLSITIVVVPNGYKFYKYNLSLVSIVIFTITFAIVVG